MLVCCYWERRQQGKSLIRYVRILYRNLYSGYSSPIATYYYIAMPKKFKGENTKAAAARERKQAAKHEVEEKKRQAEEDVYWKDDDKHSQRKQDRRVY